MIDLNKPVQTRDGRAARIVSTNGGGAFPILAVIEYLDGSEGVARFTVAGSSRLAPGQYVDDLVNTVEETEEFFNVYLDDMTFIGPKESLDEADEDADQEVRSFVIKLIRHNGEPAGVELLRHVA